MAISASTWARVDGIGLDQAITDTSTTQVYKAGFRVRCRDVGSTDRGEAEFVYAKGVASVTAGDACVVSANNDAAVLATTRSIGPVGIAMAAVVASNWGWFQVRGVAVCNVASGFADNEKCYVTGTPGTLDDSTGVTAGDLVYGARAASAIDTGKALVELMYPHVNDTDNA